MSEAQVIGWVAFVLAGMFTGFMSGYYIGYDRAIGIRKLDPRFSDWFRWPRVQVGLHDYKDDYALARELNDWLKKHVNRSDYYIKVQDDVNQPMPPYCVFYIKDRNVALTLSIKHNITYIPGYGKGYQ